LPFILFWYDVCDFNDTEANGYDKNTRLEHAWAIYNNYLNKTAKYSVDVGGLSNEMSESVRELLLKCNKINNNTSTASNNEIDFFTSVMNEIAPFLKDLWIDFLKEDIYKYTK
jgi:hypothetical protein